MSLRKPIFHILLLMLTVWISGARPAEAGGTDDPLEGVAVLGELSAGGYSASSRLAFTVKRACYSTSIRQLRAPAGHYFVIVQIRVTNLDPKPVLQREDVRIRLEEGPQSVPGWDMDEQASRKLNRASPLWKESLNPGQSIEGFAAFVLREGTKDIWYHIQSAFT